MIRLEIGLEIRHDEVIRVCATKDKTAVVVVASYRIVSRNRVRFESLVLDLCEQNVTDNQESGLHDKQS